MWSRLKRLWFGYRDARARRAYRHEPVGPAVLTYNPQHPHYVREYYLYCVHLLREALRRYPAPIQICVGDYPPARLPMPLRRVALQIEHMLVRPGGEGSAGAPASDIPLPSGDRTYLVRVLNAPELQQVDLVIDYSHANQAHLLASQCYPRIAERLIVIDPLLHAQDFGAGGRDLPLLSLFSRPNAGRRGQFLREARAAGLSIRNVRRCFSSDCLQALYRRTRVLVNLRQSQDHETIESLRILPALQSGVIVVSEDGPLRESLPYHPFLHWAPREQLIPTLRQVLVEHDRIRKALFTAPDLPEALRTLEQANRDRIDHVVQAWASSNRRASNGPD